MFDPEDSGMYIVEVKTIYGAWIAWSFVMTEEMAKREAAALGFGRGRYRLNQEYVDYLEKKESEHYKLWNKKGAKNVN